MTCLNCKKEVVKYFGDRGQLKNRYMYPYCDWCKDEFLPWIDDQYNIARRAVDDTGIVQHWGIYHQMDILYLTARTF